MVNIGSPLFDRITIHLDEDYYSGDKFVIETKNNASDHYYIQSARLNGEPINSCRIKFRDIVAGGKLELTMGKDPNMEWGTGK
jgi:putative alpha-1,2-mannosidase